ncbi:Actin-related protein 6 [Orobanche hederae]
MIFRPADSGMNQAGLAEFILRAVNSCHPHLRPVLYDRERELRPLVPDNYQVKMTTQEE